MVIKLMVLMIKKKKLSILLVHTFLINLCFFIKITNEDLRKLQLLQNRALRIILKKPRRTPIKWMLESLRLHSVKQRVNFNTLLLVFKMKNGMVPNYLQDEMLFTRDATARTLRNADDFRLPRSVSEDEHVKHDLA
jgi:hypothetical protein